LLILKGVTRDFQENLLKTDRKGDKWSEGLLLPISSLMVSGKINPPRYSSYFTHVGGMPSAGERHAFLFEKQEVGMRGAATANSGG